MLPYLRSWLGTEAAAPAPKPARAAPNADALLRAQRMQLGQLRDEAQEVREEMEAAVRASNQPLVRAKLARLKQLEGDIRLTQAKLDNVGAQQRTLQSADANVQQAVLMGAGADQLEALVREADDIDLDDVVDRLQDGAARTHEFSTRLSEPLMTHYDEGDIDEEVEQLMQRAADERTAGLLDAPTSAAVPATKPLRQQPEGMN